MATRGNKPKPAFLKLVTGNPGHRPIRGAESDGDGEQSIQARETPLQPPKRLTKAQSALWKAHIDPAWWLTEFDVQKAFMYVCLAAEHNKAPGDMIAARIAQLRVLGSELGLDPAERERMGIAMRKKQNPVDGYFD